MLLNLETIYICIYMLKNIKYAKICKIILHICNQDFMNRIYIILGYNSDYAKKYAKSNTSELYSLDFKFVKIKLN
jgi:hypothetical protein